VAAPGGVVTGAAVAVAVAGDIITGAGRERDGRAASSEKAGLDAVRPGPQQ
jgi:hypothetical protein